MFDLITKSKFKGLPGNKKKSKKKSKKKNQILIRLFITAKNRGGTKANNIMPG
jgi:hypothetical protein